MSTADLIKFPGGSPAKGVSNFTPSIGSEITWTQDTFNVTCGIVEGVGPRYGMAPIPGQMDEETLSANQLPNLIVSETTSGAIRLVSRQRCFGILPFKLNNVDFTNQITQYAYLVGSGDVNSMAVGLTWGSTYNGTYLTYVNDIRAGLHGLWTPLLGIAPSYPMYELVPLATATTAGNVADVVLLNELNETDVLLKAMSFDSISITGQDNPMRFCLGKTIVDPDATHGPQPNFWLSSGYAGSRPNINCGLPPEYNSKTFRTNLRSLLFLCYANTGAKVDMWYVHNIYPTTSTFLTGYRIDTTNKNIDLTGNTGTKSGASVAYSSVDAVVVDDKDCVCNSSYKAVAVACNEAKIAIIQDWMTGKQGSMEQWCDPTVHRAAPKQYPTANYYASTNQLSGFMSFPGFTRGTAMVEADGIQLGPVDSGVLTKNTVYEFSYSLFNKRLNFETNVGPGVKFQTGVNDNISLQIWDSTEFATGTPFSVLTSTYATSSTTLLPFVFNEDGGLNINYYQYRFYYREEGTFEWLPAGNIDAVDYWFVASRIEDHFVCTGATAGLPGGQPNGFIDNSPLSRDRYRSVVTWKSRLWWISDKAINFSLQNNVFVYPTRNSIVSGTGTYLGAIAHNHPGPYTQDSRLVIFGSKEIYIARFTGNFMTSPVRVSPDTVGEYPIDASDLTIDTWTSITAFSARAACVADGVLYYWGPQGVRVDNGTETPTNLSEELEPDIFTMYDPNRTAEINCIYNDQTKEIIWFYPPKVADSPYITHSLIFNTRTGKFSYQKFRSEINSAFKLNLTSNDGVSRDRTLVSFLNYNFITNAGTVELTTSQQVVTFFDQYCRSADMPPFGALLVKQISTPSAGVKRLSLARGYLNSGSPSLRFTNYVQIGDLLAFDQFGAYTNTSTDTDKFIARIVATSYTSSSVASIDIALPDGVTLTDATFTQPYFAPIWVTGDDALGFQGVKYQIDTNYWVPTQNLGAGGASMAINAFGMSNSWNWLYFYFLFKYSGIPTPNDPFTNAPVGIKIDMTYRSLVCSGAITDILSLENNSAGNCQIHHPLRNEGRAGSGQALKHTLSGINAGGSWTLQYLEAHCLKEKGFTLKEFEG